MTAILIFFFGVLAFVAICAGFSILAGILAIPFAAARAFTDFFKDVSDSRQAEKKAKAFLSSPEWQNLKGKIYH